MTTYLRYSQIRVADTLNDQLPASSISGADSSSVTQEDLQTYVLSQIKRIIHGDNAGNWYDDFGGSSISSLQGLSAATSGLGTKMFIRRLQQTQNVTVPSSQNWKILNFSGGEVPSGYNLSLSGSTEGLVAATLGAGQIGSWRGTVVAGNPEKNAVGVRLASDNSTLYTAATQATLTINGADANGNVTYTAKNAGTPGNTITVAHIVAGNSTPLSVSVTGYAITVNVATDSSGNPTSTATQVAAAITASIPAAALVTATASGTGASVVGAEAATNLAGAEDATEVLALLQAESTAVDGGVPNDATGGNRLQVSFVVRDPSTENFVAAPPSAVANKVVQFLFPVRQLLTNLPEEAILSAGTFLDTAAQGSVTQQAAYMGGNTVTVETALGDFVVNLGDDGTHLKWQVGSSAAVTLTRDDTLGALLQTDTPRLTFNNTQTATFNKGVVVDNADTGIGLGTTVGAITRSTSLTVKAQAGSLTLQAQGGGNNIALTSAGDITFNDSRFGAFPLSDATTGPTGGAAWTTDLGSPPSLVSAINRAAGIGGKAFRYGSTTHSGGTIAAGTNVPGGNFFDFAGLANEIDTFTFYDSVNANASAQNVFVAVNGRRLMSGNSGTPNDVRLGITPANGDLVFTFPIRDGDFIEAWAQIRLSGTA